MYKLLQRDYHPNFPPPINQIRDNAIYSRHAVSLQFIYFQLTFRHPSKLVELNATVITV